MRALLAGMLFVMAAACGGRKVNVEAAPRTTAAVTLNFTNNDANAVNVYVVADGNDTFLKQVAANSTEVMPGPGIAAGTHVRLTATRTDGSKTYTSDPITLTATSNWRVP